MLYVYPFTCARGPKLKNSQGEGGQGGAIPYPLVRASCEVVTRPSGRGKKVNPHRVPLSLRAGDKGCSWSDKTLCLF